MNTTSRLGSLPNAVSLAAAATVSQKGEVTRKAMVMTTSVLTTEPLPTERDLLIRLLDRVEDADAAIMRLADFLDWHTKHQLKALPIAELAGEWKTRSETMDLSWRAVAEFVAVPPMSGWEPVMDRAQAAGDDVVQWRSLLGEAILRQLEDLVMRRKALCRLKDDIQRRIRSRSATLEQRDKRIRDLWKEHGCPHTWKKFSCEVLRRDAVIRVLGCEIDDKGNTARNVCVPRRRRKAK